MIRHRRLRRGSTRWWKALRWYAEKLIIIVPLLAIFLSLVVLALPYLGWDNGAIISGSMEPTLEVGSMVVTQPYADSDDPQVGDIITFTRPGLGVICHRIVSLNPAGPGYITQGDANNSADLWVVQRKEIIGKVVFHVPYLGYTSDFVRSKYGFLFLILLPGLVIAVVELQSIRRELESRRDRVEDTQLTPRVRRGGWPLFPPEMKAPDEEAEE